jgi:hypothetical protein
MRGRVIYVSTYDYEQLLITVATVDILSSINEQGKLDAKTARTHHNDRFTPMESIFTLYSTAVFQTKDAHYFWSDL